MAFPGKLYVVSFGGTDYLVRAFTQRGAAKGLIRFLTDSALENTRPASQDDILELACKGVRPIDVTATEPEDQVDAGSQE